jgi:hypothetical protein
MKKGYELEIFLFKFLKKLTDELVASTAHF